MTTVNQSPWLHLKIRHKNTHTHKQFHNKSAEWIWWLDFRANLAISLILISSSESKWKQQNNQTYQEEKWLNRKLFLHTAKWDLFFFFFFYIFFFIISWVHVHKQAHTYRVAFAPWLRGTELAIAIAKTRSRHRLIVTVAIVRLTHQRITGENYILIENYAIANHHYTKSHSSKSKIIIKFYFTKACALCMFTIFTRHIHIRFIHFFFSFVCWFIRWLSLCFMYFR